MPGLTFIEYPPEMHDEVKIAIQEIKEDFKEEFSEFLDECRQTALERSYFMESIGLADYEFEEKLNWEIGRRTSEASCHDIPGYPIRCYSLGMSSGPRETLASLKEKVDVKYFDSSVKILRDIDLKLKSLRKTRATSVTLTDGELKVYNQKIGV